MADKGNLYVIAAPSGTGKTSLVKALVDSMNKIMVSISHTTRDMRPGEINGTNYYFVDNAEFERMIAHNDFLEHATIFDHLYGTSKSWVEKALANGIDVILEIDWQGHQQIKKILPDTIGIFILPPSLNDLRTRLVKRNQDHEDVIRRRLADASETVSHIHEFDYIVVNDDFNEALVELETIVLAERLLEKRQSAKLAGLIDDLVGMK